MRGGPTNRPIQHSPGGMIIVLNGFPGTGKHTILRRLKTLLPPDRSVRLVDNHLLIDPAAALYPNRGDDFHNLRHAIREAFFPYITRLSQEGHVILLTACLAANNDRDAAFLQEHVDLVRGTGVPLYWINTYCERTCLVERVQSYERVHSSKTKLTDVSTLLDLLETHTLIEPEETDDVTIKLVVRSLDMNGQIDESVHRLMALVGLQLSVKAHSG